jgi:hypothetical protein
MCLVSAFLGFKTMVQEYLIARPLLCRLVALAEQVYCLYIQMTIFVLVLSFFFFFTHNNEGSMLTEIK